MAIIRLDLDKCVSCGRCMSICPDIFSMDDDFRPVIIGGTRASNILMGKTQHIECVKLASKECMVEAILLE